MCREIKLGTWRLGVIWVLNAIINCKFRGQETGTIFVKSTQRAGHPAGIGSGVVDGNIRLSDFLKS